MVKGEENKCSSQQTNLATKPMCFLNHTHLHLHTNALSLWHFNQMLCAFITILPHISLCNFLGCCRNNASAVLLDNNSDLSLFLLLQQLLCASHDVTNSKQCPLQTEPTTHNAWYSQQKHHREWPSSGSWAWTLAMLPAAESTAHL